MGSKIFSSSAGLVVHVPMDANASLGFVKYKDMPEGVVVTGIGTDLRENVQFVQSLSQSVHVYAFGSHVANVKIDGLVLMRWCHGGDTKSGGFSNLLRFYNEKRASKSGVPISFTVAGSALSGYIVGANVRILSDALGLGSFTLELASTEMVQV